MSKNNIVDIKTKSRAGVEISNWIRLKNWSRLIVFIRDVLKSFNITFHN
ncbi:hypothetical protein [[Mycoplasma] anseris]